MSWTLWSSLFVVCLLGAMSPGPSLAIVTKHTLGSGRTNGMAAAWAHACGIGIYAMVTVIGLSVVLLSAPVVYGVLSLFGGGYLCYLGWGALNAKHGIAQTLESGKPTAVATSAKEGFLISILSPKIAIFFTALFAQFVPAIHSNSGNALLVSTPLIVDGLWYTLIAFLLSTPKFMSWLQQKAVWIDRISGAILILLGVRVIWYSVTTILT